MVRAQLLSLPPPMSRLDTILNPQENIIPTLRPEYVFNSLDEPL